MNGDWRTLYQKLYSVLIGIVAKTCVRLQRAAALGFSTMKSYIRGAVASMALALCTVPVMAQDLEFTLTNDSSYILTYFYTSPSNDDFWGEDLFSELGVLEPGYQATVFIGDGSDQCLYDFRFETAEGPELEVAAIDICELGSYTLTD